MWRHIAAPLYGVGVRLDNSLALFCELRGVDVNQLVVHAVTEITEACCKNPRARVPPTTRPIYWYMTGKKQHTTVIA